MNLKRFEDVRGC